MSDDDVGTSACNDVRRRHKNDPRYMAIVADRTYDFSFAVPLFGARFAERAALSWEAGSGTLKLRETVCFLRKSFQALRRFLLWGAGESESCGPSEFCLSRRLQELDDSPITISELRGCVDNFRKAVLDSDTLGGKVRKSKRNTIESLNRGFQICASGGLWPSVGHIRGYRRQFDESKTPTLAELTRSRANEDAPLHYKNYVKLNEQRLARFRSLAARAFQERYATFLRGRELAATVAIPARDIKELTFRLRKLEAPVFNKHKKLIPAQMATLRQRKLNEVLAFTIRTGNCEIYWDGLMKLKVFQNVISRRDFQSMVHADNFGLITATTVILCDTGLNVQPLFHLAADPYIEQPRSGRRRLAVIGAAKNRAKGKVVEAVLGDEGIVAKNGPTGEMSGVDVISAWQQMTEPLRAAAARSNLPPFNYLWILPPGITHATPLLRRAHHVNTARWWKGFLHSIKDDEVVGGLPINRVMIRRTILQLQAARHNFNHVVSRVHGSHQSSQTTIRYLSGKYFRALLEEKIRDFQRTLETTLSANIDGWGEALGLTAPMVEARLQESMDTGIGYLCVTPFNSPLPEVSEDTLCTKVERCVDCTSRRFVATVDSIRRLIKFNLSIKRDAERMIAEMPTRWEAVWLPNLAMTEAVLLRLTNSRWKFDVERIGSEINDNMESGREHPISLW